jgi:aspartate aminotransferase
MAFLADKMNTFKPSPTIAVASKARLLKSQGIDVIDLSTGDPIIDEQYPIPKSLEEAAIFAIKNRKTGYTAPNGIAQLREAILKKTKRDNNIEYNDNQIAVGCGAKQIIFNAILATINALDEVIIPAPYWVSYGSITELFGGVSVIVKCSPENGYKITAEQLEAAITPKTKWFIINSPVNPTGSVYTLQELEAIALVLKKHPHVHIMSDDIYEYLIFNPEQKFYNLINADASLKDRTLLINGTAKSHAMTGWRIAYGLGNTEIISALNGLQTQSTSNACTISQYAAVAALEDGKNNSQYIIPIIKERAIDFCAKISNLTKLKPLMPDGAFYVFIDASSYIGTTIHGTQIQSDVDIANILLEKGRVAVVPGAAFGYDNHFRISLANSSILISQAADRIAQALLD